MGRFPSGQREQTVNLPLLASVVRIHPCPPYLREWRNWQTRMIQVHVYVRTCRFKSCFPHQTKTLEKSRVFAIFGGPKTGFECNYECNWSRLTPILAGIGWDYFFIFKKIFSCLIFSTVYPTHTQSPPLWSNCRAQCLNCRIDTFQMTKVFDILSS